MEETQTSPGVPGTLGRGNKRSGIGLSVTAPRRQKAGFWLGIVPWGPLWYVPRMATEPLEVLGTREVLSNSGKGEAEAQMMSITHQGDLSLCPEDGPWNTAHSHGTQLWSSRTGVPSEQAETRQSPAVRGVWCAERQDFRVLV